MTHDEKLITIRAMKMYGGSFVKVLAELWLLADEENAARIEKAWPEYVSKYGPGMPMAFCRGYEAARSERFTRDDVLEEAAKVCRAIALATEPDDFALDAANLCVAAIEALKNATPPSHTEQQDDLRALMLDFRDAILNERGAIAENGMTNDQINDVLLEFDKRFPARSTPAPKNTTPDDRTTP